MTRKIKFKNQKYYHIYNRGTDKRKIFLEKGDLYYFFDALFLSNQEKRISDNYKSKNHRKNEKEKAKMQDKLVDIIAYSLLPNHFHLILKQRIDGGISKFMHKLGVSYTKYFNEKYGRNGVLFQGKFKASELKFDGSVERMSIYVNLNYKHHNYNFKKDLIKTSVFEYLGEEKGDLLCNQNEIKQILKGEGGMAKYKKKMKNLSKIFVEDHGWVAKKITFEELE